MSDQLRHIFYNYDDMPLVEWRDGRPIRGTPEWFEKHGFTVHRNKPDAHCFTVEPKEHNAGTDFINDRDSRTLDQS